MRSEKYSSGAFDSPPICRSRCTKGFALEKKYYTIEEVALAAEAASHKQSDVERRKFARTPIQGTLTAELHPLGSPPFKVRLKDLSRGGIGFYSDRHLQRQEKIILIARLRNELLQLECSVKRCYLDKSGDHYVVGAQIDEVRRSKEMQAAPIAPRMSLAQQIFESPPADVDVQHVTDVQQRLRELLDRPPGS